MFLIRLPPFMREAVSAGNHKTAAGVVKSADALWDTRGGHDPTVRSPRPKMGMIRNKSVDWSNSDTFLLGKSIGKAIVSPQIPEVLSDETIQVLLCKKFESAKRLYRFKPRNFQRWSDTSTFTPKILNQQSDCIASNPRIFKGEAIQVLLCQRIWIGKAIVLFQTPEFF